MPFHKDKDILLKKKKKKWTRILMKIQESICAKFLANGVALIQLSSYCSCHTDTWTYGHHRTLMSKRSSWPLTFGLRSSHCLKTIEVIFTRYGFYPKLLCCHQHLVKGRTWSSLILKSSYFFNFIQVILTRYGLYLMCYFQHLVKGRTEVIITSDLKIFILPWCHKGHLD